MTTARELIKSSLRLINVISTNEEPTSDDVDIAKEALNALISSKANDLLNIHTMTPRRFTLESGKAQYTVGPSVDEAGNPTNADWITERPMRIEQAVLMLYTNFLDFSASPTSGEVPLTTTFTVTE